MLNLVRNADRRSDPQLSLFNPDADNDRISLSKNAIGQNLQPRREDGHVFKFFLLPLFLVDQMFRKGVGQVVDNVGGKDL